MNYKSNLNVQLNAKMKYTVSTTRTRNCKNWTAMSNIIGIKKLSLPCNSIQWIFILGNANRWRSNHETVSWLLGVIVRKRNALTMLISIKRRRRRGFRTIIECPKSKAPYRWSECSSHVRMHVPLAHKLRPTVVKKTQSKHGVSLQSSTSVMKTRSHSILYSDPMVQTNHSVFSWSGCKYSWFFGHVFRRSCYRPPVYWRCTHWWHRRHNWYAALPDMRRCSVRTTRRKIVFSTFPHVIRAPSIRKLQQ